jgi:hypothetical protein
MKRSVSLVWIVLAIAAAAVGMWNGRAGAGASGAAEETARVLAFADQTLAHNYHISLQYYGEMDGQNADALVSRMDGILDLERMQTAAPDLQTAYRLNAGSGTITFVRHGGTEGRVQSVVRLEGGRQDTAQLLLLQSELDALLAPVSDNGLWSTKTEGSWNAVESAEKGVSPEKAVEALAEGLLKAKPQDVYREGSMSHMTFTSEMLSVKASKRNATALQTSLLRDSVTGEWKLAIGAPLLTGEF